MISRLERRRDVYKRKKYFHFAISFLFLIISTIIFIAVPENVVPASTTYAAHSSFTAWKRYLPEWRDVLCFGIPGLETMYRIKSTNLTADDYNLQQVLHRTMILFTGIDVLHPRSFLDAEIALLTVMKSDASTAGAKSPPPFPELGDFKKASDGKPLVGIYHTHTAESFIPTSGAAHKPGGQVGDIVDVGAALQTRLANYGICAVQSKAIHDYPSFMKAYSLSEITVKKMLEENPSIQMVFDIHRDADKKENQTIAINGVQAAKITILVATGQPDLPQPHWQQNHAFAKLLESKLNQHFPGISRGIQLVEWRYNQHLHPRALLIEVGCQENSREEAVRTIEMLGDVLAEIVNENSGKQ